MNTNTVTKTSKKKATADRLDFVSLQVRDLERSRRFYTDVLGFDALPQDRPDAIVFRTQGGAVFAVRKPMVDLDATKHLGWGVGLWFGSSDVDGLHARVAEARAPIARPLADGPFGRLFVVADPDGYLVTLHQAGK